MSHDLLQETPRIENDLTTQSNIKVLEWDRQHVPVVQRAQRLVCGRERAAVAYTVEI